MNCGWFHLDRLQKLSLSIQVGPLTDKGMGKCDTKPFCKGRSKQHEPIPRDTTQVMGRVKIHTFLACKNESSTRK